jgi:hypothetical protein
MRLGFLVVCSVVLFGFSVACSDPGPGDIFREYTWKGPWKNAGNWQRVTDPNARHSGAQEFLPNPVNNVLIEDLKGAVRVEIYIEQWGGHAGTSNKRLRINGHDWIRIPEPIGIPRDAGKSRDPECYQYLTYPSVSVPLEQLQEGANTFEFTCDGQICFDYGWGQWGVYGVTFRIYYDASKPHPTGRIILPMEGSTVRDSVQLEATSSSPNGSIQQVDFIGYYEDFDYEGNGVYRQWHYNYRYGKIKRHLGTAESAPYGITWNTAWVPDQDEPMKFMARIEDTDGTCYLTPEVGPIFLACPGKSVKLYKPYDVPGSWQTRAGKTHTCKVFVPHDLSRAKAARIVLTTWSGAHAEAIGMNDSLVVKRVGLDHDYSYDEVPVPLAYLRLGTNTPYTYSSTEHHGIEVLWPGIVLMVQYEDLVETSETRTEDLQIFADVLPTDWVVQSKPAASALFNTSVDPTADVLPYRGSSALEVKALRMNWGLELESAVPVDIRGYTSLRFVLHPNDIEPVPIWAWFWLHINDQRLSLLGGDLENIRVDMNRKEWQVVEIPLDSLAFRFPYLESIRFTASFTGTFYLDDLRLIASPPGSETAVSEEHTASRPGDVFLMQNFPNPFNPSTAIRFSLPEQSQVELIIYSLLGQKLTTLVEGVRPAGLHTLHWDGRDASGRALADGVYLYRLQAGEQTQTRRLVLLR